MRGRPIFPEFHNVYIEPRSYEVYKKTNVFPEGTIFFKELQLTVPAENADGSSTEPLAGAQRSSMSSTHRQERSMPSRKPASSQTALCW
jgi:hypothetical protein